MVPVSVSHPHLDCRPSKDPHGRFLLKSRHGPQAALSVGAIGEPSQTGNRDQAQGVESAREHREIGYEVERARGVRAPWVPMKTLSLLVSLALF